MNPNELNQLLDSLPTPLTPRGLEGKVLRAVHEKQQKEALLHRYLQRTIVILVSCLYLASGAHLVMGLAQNGFQTIIETIINNANVLPLRYSFLALLETIPFDRLAITISLTFIVCLMFYRRQSHKLPKPKTSLTLSHI